MCKARPCVFACAGLLCLALLLPHTDAAAWPGDPVANVPLCTASGTQTSATIVPDGMGGAIVAWLDLRSGTRYDIYAQRISWDGTVLWAADGVALCTGPSANPFPYSMTSDGAGGAIVAWQSYGFTREDIYAQRVNAAGEPQWGAGGVGLCTAYSSQTNPVIATDGAGGAIVAWTDYRSNRYDTYAQRVNAGGLPLWAGDGARLCIDCQCEAIAPDGAGGGIVTWATAIASAQRVSAAGVPQWGANGVALCTTGYSQANPVISPDGTGGAIVAWQDLRGGDYDLFAQRVNAAGVSQWSADGVALCTMPEDQECPNIISDGAGGAIVAWQDLRSGFFSGDVYAQRVSSAGTVLWGTFGTALCTATGIQACPAVASDGSGGAIVAWGDPRSGNGDCYAQRISAAGVPQWAADGAALCAAANDQGGAAIVSDGAGGAIGAWTDYRNGNPDIYAQRIWANGSTPVVLSLVSAEVTANAVDLTWFTSGSGSADATVYRSSGGSSWTRIGRISPDGTGYLRYTDPIDGAATRIGYRLGVLEAGVEHFYGETWVDLPGRESAFALEPVRPNPSRGGSLTIHFALHSGAASLELLDVAGRRITVREVGSLGAGHHVVELWAGRALAPGLYTVRLRQGADLRTARVSVVR